MTTDPTKSKGELLLALALINLANAVRLGDQLDRSGLAQALRAADRLLLDGCYVHGRSGPGPLKWIGD